MSKGKAINLQSIREAGFHKIRMNDNNAMRMAMLLMAFKLSLKRITPARTGITTDILLDTAVIATPAFAAEIANRWKTTIKVIPKRIDSNNRLVSITPASTDLTSITIPHAMAMK